LEEGFRGTVRKAVGPSISLSGRGLSQNGPEDQQVVCSVNALLCMSYAHEGVWAGADLDEDPQPTMEAAEPQQTIPSTGGFSEAVEPQQTGSSTGGFSDAELGALTPEEMQVVIENDRLTDRHSTFRAT